MLSLKEIDKLTPDAVKEYLKQIVEHLDELDGDDTFGTEGWRYSFGFED